MDGPTHNITWVVRSTEGRASHFVRSRNIDQDASRTRRSIDLHLWFARTYDALFQDFWLAEWHVEHPFGSNLAEPLEALAAIWWA